MQNTTVNVNGQILEGTVSVFDRGYLYGDSIYEVVRTYQDQFFLLEEHLNRLKKSAELCQITLSQSLSVFRDEIYRTFQIFKTLQEDPSTQAYLRIIVSRGVGKIGFGRSTLLTPTQYTIIVQPVTSPAPAVIQKGLSLKISKRLRNDRLALDPAMKSGNYLNSLLAFLEAEAENFDDALLCNSESHLTEGTTFNLFYVRRGILATPPLDIGILDGITRRHVLTLARELKIPTREVRFPKQRLYEADEVFISSSIREIVPITRIDDRVIKDGIPGSITIKLMKGYLESLPNKS